MSRAHPFSSRTPVFVAHTPFHLTHFLLFNFYCTYLFLFLGGWWWERGCWIDGFFLRSIDRFPSFRVPLLWKWVFSNRGISAIPSSDSFSSERDSRHQSFQLGDYLVSFYFSLPLLTPTQVIWSSHLSYFGKSTLKEIVHSEGTLMDPEGFYISTQESTCEKRKPLGLAVAGQPFPTCTRP